MVRGHSNSTFAQIWQLLDHPFPLVRSLNSQVWTVRFWQAPSPLLGRTYCLNDPLVHIKNKLFKIRMWLSKMKSQLERIADDKGQGPVICVRSQLNYVIYRGFGLIHERSTDRQEHNYWEFSATAFSSDGAELCDNDCTSQLSVQNRVRNQRFNHTSLGRSYFLSSCILTYTSRVGVGVWSQVQKRNLCPPDLRLSAPVHEVSTNCPLNVHQLKETPSNHRCPHLSASFHSCSSAMRDGQELELSAPFRQLSANYERHLWTRAVHPCPHLIAPLRTCSHQMSAKCPPTKTDPWKPELFDLSAPVWKMSIS